jgi:hypothetical protein
MSDKDFLLNLASAELAYATSLMRSDAKVKLEKAAEIMDNAKKHLQEAMNTDEI